MRPVLDVTDHVGLGGDGNPLFADLDKEAKDLLKTLLKQDKEGKVK